MTMFCYAAKIPKANQIGFGIGRLKCKVPQRDVRLFLVLIHLIVLVSAIASFTAARCSETSLHIPYLRMSAKMEEISLQDGVTMKKYLTISQQELTSAIHNHIEAILYITSFNLLLYWLIYGVAVAYKFGGFCELCILIVSVPHTVVMVVWELGLAAFFVKIEHVGFYATWAPTLATIFIVTSVVQLGTAMLPFLISDSTSVFQNMNEIAIGRHFRRNGELPLTIERTRREPGRRATVLPTGRYTTQQRGDREISSSSERHRRYPGDLEHPSTTGQHSRQPVHRELPSTTGRHARQPGNIESPLAILLHTRQSVDRELTSATGRHPQYSGDSERFLSVRHVNNPEYVEFSPFESSLYLTEMPEQILRRERSGCVAGLDETSVRAEQRVLNTMYSKSGDKACTAPSGDSHQYNLLPSHLKADDILPGVYLTCSDSDSNFLEDYMDMKGEMPPASCHSLGIIV